MDEEKKEQTNNGDTNESQHGAWSGVIVILLILVIGAIYMGRYLIKTAREQKAQNQALQQNASQENFNQ